MYSGGGDITLRPFFNNPYSSSSRLVLDVLVTFGWKVKLGCRCYSSVYYERIDLSVFTEPEGVLHGSVF